MRESFHKIVYYGHRTFTFFSYPFVYRLQQQFIQEQLYFWYDQKVETNLKVIYDVGIWIMKLLIEHLNVMIVVRSNNSKKSTDKLIK